MDSRVSPAFGSGPGCNVAIICHDEKPGTQAIGNTAPDPPPQPGSHATSARPRISTPWHAEPAGRDDLLTGKVHAGVEDRHRSREFVGLLKKIDAAYPADTAIKLIPDNHSVHVSKETKAWLATRPEGCFSFVLTQNTVPGSIWWGASSPRWRDQCSVTLRVAANAELKSRILAYLEELNRDPVIHTWTYKIGKAA